MKCYYCKTTVEPTEMFSPAPVVLEPYENVVLCKDCANWVEECRNEEIYKVENNG